MKDFLDEEYIGYTGEISKSELMSYIRMNNIDDDTLVKEYYRYSCKAECITKYIILCGIVAIILYSYIDINMFYTVVGLMTVCSLFIIPKMIEKRMNGCVEYIKNERPSMYNQALKSVYTDVELLNAIVSSIKKKNAKH